MILSQRTVHYDNLLFVQQQKELQNIARCTGDLPGAQHVLNNAAKVPLLDVPMMDQT